jgi:hypothetical protein
MVFRRKGSCHDETGGASHVGRRAAVDDQRLRRDPGPYLLSFRRRRRASRLLLRRALRPGLRPLRRLRCALRSDMWPGLWSYVRSYVRSYVWSGVRPGVWTCVRTGVRTVQRNRLRPAPCLLRLRVRGRSSSGALAVRTVQLELRLRVRRDVLGRLVRSTRLPRSLQPVWALCRPGLLWRMRRARPGLSAEYGPLRPSDGRRRGCQPLVARSAAA